MKGYGRLKTAIRINDEWWLDGFFGMIIEGKQRIGKSSYANKNLAMAHGKWELINRKPWAISSLDNHFP